MYNNYSGVLNIDIYYYIFLANIDFGSDEVVLVACLVMRHASY